MAGIISLLNEFRISEGDPALGFLNTWSYDVAPRSFNDIIKGTNPGCGTVGFSAVTGWDPVRSLQAHF